MSQSHWHDFPQGALAQGIADKHKELHKNYIYMYVCMYIHIEGCPVSTVWRYYDPLDVLQSLWGRQVRPEKSCRWLNWNYSVRLCSHTSSQYWMTWHCINVLLSIHTARVKWICTREWETQEDPIQQDCGPTRWDVERQTGQVLDRMSRLATCFCSPKTPFLMSASIGSLCPHLVLELRPFILP